MNGNDTQVLTFDPNGGLIKIETSGLNRAMLFGDGIFETIIFWHGGIRFAKEHQERLNKGMNLLKMIPSGLTIQHIEQYIKRNFPDEKQLRIRWNVYRIGLGKYTPLDHHTKDQVLIQSLNQPSKIKKKSYISTTISISPSPWSKCKTLNGLPYVMANIEREELAMDEVILLDDKGFISEAGSANIFWVKGNVFYTPSLSCNCIAGVGRKKIIETLEEAGHTVIEGRFTVEELLEAEQVFTSNVTGIAYIAKLGSKSFLTTPLPKVEQVFE